MFKVGDMIIPISKSIGCSLNDSVVWQRAQKLKQKFLYITRIDVNDNNIIKRVICNSDIKKTGDFFLISDLILFNENMTIVEYALYIGGE